MTTDHTDGHGYGSKIKERTLKSLIRAIRGIRGHPFWGEDVGGNLRAPTRNGTFVSRIKIARPVRTNFCVPSQSGLRRSEFQKVRPVLSVLSVAIRGFFFSNRG